MLQKSNILAEKKQTLRLDILECQTAELVDVLSIPGADMCTISSW